MILSNNSKDIVVIKNDVRHFIEHLMGTKQNITSYHNPALLCTISKYRRGSRSRNTRRTRVPPSHCVAR